MAVARALIHDVTSEAFYGTIRVRLIHNFKKVAIVDLK